MEQNGNGVGIECDMIHVALHGIHSSLYWEWTEKDNGME